ncbi:MAG: tRNA epoxyqueuosine(34) reductase QueG, partial [Bacteroidia bacterium]|nr:tRNA epoxyqueuosine(34) reductase QueG [Bacteroidia bacterium]
AYGCDICQDVCPWNRFSTEHNEADFLPQKDLLEMTKEDWENMDETTFDSLFYNSAVKRTGYSGLKRNVGFLS